MRRTGDAVAHRVSIPPDYFRQRYEASDDPWRLASSPYERRKLAVVTASLPRERYVRCFEPACAIGELTAVLAKRCDSVLAVDCVDTAVRRTRSRFGGVSGVEVRRAVLPAELPDGPFDLVVLSEFLYYFSARELELLLDGVLDRMAPGGDLVCVHARDRDNPVRYDGFNVHCEILARPGLRRLVHHDDDGFVLDILRAT